MFGQAILENHTRVCGEYLGHIHVGDKSRKIYMFVCMQLP